VLTEDLLNLLDICDKIDIGRVLEQADEMKKNKYLSQHPYVIFQGKDGKWRTYLPKEDGGRRQLKRTTKQSIEKAVVDYWKEQEVNPTLEELFNEWNDKRYNRGKICGATYHRYKSHYKRHFREFGKTRILSLTTEKALDFLEGELSDKRLTAKAFYGMKSILTGILKTAKRKKLTDIVIHDLYEQLDVTDHDFQVTFKEDYEEVFSEEEVTEILSYLLTNLDTHNMGILLMFLTGIRVGELSTLKPCDIGEGSIKIRRTESRDVDENGNAITIVKDFPKTKAGFREIALPEGWEWLLKRLKNLNPFQEYLFNQSWGKRITARSFRRRLHDICKELNIYPKTPHKIRKTYATILMDAGLDKQFIINQMGHSSIALTENAYHRNRKTMDTKRRILGEITEFKSNQVINGNQEMVSNT
jgi:integrase